MKVKGNIHAICVCVCMHTSVCMFPPVYLSTFTSMLPVLESLKQFGDRKESRTVFVCHQVLKPSENLGDLEEAGKEWGII